MPSTRQVGSMVDVTDASHFPLLGPRVRFMQHRGCLNPTANEARQNTPSAAIEVLDCYRDETWFAGLEMDVCYCEHTIKTAGSGLLERGWIAAHDPPDRDEGEHVWAFDDYLRDSVPRLLEYGKRLNVEVKGQVTDTALKELAALVETRFQHVGGDAKDYVLFTSFRAANLVLLGERGYPVGLFVHHHHQRDKEADEFEVLIQDGFSWAEKLASASRAKSLHLFLILRLHGSAQMDERQVKEWEERALKMNLQLWYTGTSAEDACKLASLKYDLCKGQQGDAEQRTAVLPAPADPVKPWRESAEECQPLLVVIDDDLPLNPDRLRYMELYGRYSGVAWRDASEPAAILSY
jgi:hypothetical protein